MHSTFRAFSVAVVLLFQLVHITSGSVTTRALFEQHARKHNVDVGTTAEFAKRFGIFKQNLKKINAHNSDPSSTHKLVVNKFAHLSADEFASLMGLDQSSSKNRKIPNDDKIRSLRSLPNDGEEQRRLEVLPLSKDWASEGGVTPVKDQGACGASWAFAATGAIEGAYYVKHGSLPYSSPASPESGFVGLSEQQLLSCEQINSGCFIGGIPQYGFMFAADNLGIASEVAVPYTSGYDPTNVGKCDDTAEDSSDYGTAVMLEAPFINVFPNVQSMMYAVLQQPVAVTINAAYDAFQFYNFGTISNLAYCPPGDEQHSALLVGYGVDENDLPFWEVKFSWGKDWGDGGFVRILRSEDNVCGLLNHGTYPNLAPDADEPTSKPSPAPTWRPGSASKTLATTPGLTLATGAQISVLNGDASLVIFTTASINYLDSDTSEEVRLPAKAYRIQDYPCSPQQCLWVLAFLDDESSYTTTVFPLHVVSTGSSTVSAFLQEGFEVYESVPLTPLILQYYMNGYYLKQSAWAVNYSPNPSKTSYSIDSLAYSIKAPLPSARPTLSPTAKPTTASQSVPATGWYVMTTYASSTCDATTANSQTSKGMGVCTMDTANADTYLYWYIDTFVSYMPSSKTFIHKRIYYEDEGCTVLAATGPTGLTTEPEVTSTWGSCLKSLGTGSVYGSYMFSFVREPLVPSAPFSGYVQTTYASDSTSCIVDDVTTASVYKSNAYCYTYSNRSVTFDCTMDNQPVIHYYESSDNCKGAIVNSQPYSQQCFFSVDFQTKTSITCGTGPVAPVDPPSSAITGYVQTVTYADQLCQSPVFARFVSQGLCLKNADGSYSRRSIVNPQTSKLSAKITTSTFTDASCLIPKALTTTTTTTVATRQCVMNSDSLTSTKMHVLRSAAAQPNPPVYIGGELAVYPTGSCTNENFLETTFVALDRCMAVNATTSFMLSCVNGGAQATHTTFFGSSTCSQSAKKTTDTYDATPDAVCVAAPSRIADNYAFPVSVRAKCAPFPTSAINSYLVQSNYYAVNGDNSCSASAGSGGGPNGGVVYTSLGLCTKTDSNDTFYTMTLPGTAPTLTSSWWSGSAVNISSANNIISLTTLRFTDPSCSVQSNVGIPFRRSLRLGACIQTGQNMYTKMSIISAPSGQQLPSTPYKNGVYTEAQSLPATQTTSTTSAAATCAQASLLTYSAYPVDACVTISPELSIIITCTTDKKTNKPVAALAWYSSPTCTASKLSINGGTSVPTEECVASTLDKDYTYLLTEDKYSCVAPTTIGTPSALPTRAPASNTSYVPQTNTINGWVSTTHYDSNLCTFAIDFNADSFGLCMMNIQGGDDTATVYYQDSLSTLVYVSNTDSTQRFYYQYRAFFTDDKCTVRDNSRTTLKSTVQYYKCTMDDTGYWTKTGIVRSGVVSAKPKPPAEINPSRAFTYYVYNDNKCSASEEISENVVPELTCAEVLSPNGTLVFQRVQCDGNAVNQTVTFSYYADDGCSKHLLSTTTHEATACSEFSDPYTGDPSGAYVSSVCPYRLPDPTAAPVPASAPTNINGEIQGWITQFRFASKDVCENRNPTDALYSMTFSYGLCTVSNHSIARLKDYIYELTTIYPLLMAEEEEVRTTSTRRRLMQRNNNHLTADSPTARPTVSQYAEFKSGQRIQMQTSYFTDPACTTPSNRYQKKTVLKTLANCEDAYKGGNGMYVAEMFAPGFLEPASYPGISAGFQITTNQVEGCPVERELSSKTVKASNMGRNDVACIPTSAKTSVAYACTMNDTIGSGAIEYRFPTPNCSGDWAEANATTILAVECEPRRDSTGSTIYLSAYCQTSGLSHRVAPMSQDVTAWVSTITYSDDNCLYPSFQQSVSYGICFPASGDSADRYFFMDSLGISAADGESVPVMRYFYSDDLCFSPIDSMQPQTRSVKLFKDCTPSDAGYIMSYLTRGSQFPRADFSGGFQYTEYDTSAGGGYCDPSVAKTQFTALGDNSCVQLSSNTSVKFDCTSQLDLDENRGLKYTKTTYSNTDCSGEDGVSSIELVQDTCATSSDGSILFTSVCNVVFPTPTLAPIPSSGIKNWITTTEYGPTDSYCNNTKPVAETLESFGVCTAFSDEVWTITDLNMESAGSFAVDYTIFFFSDADCSTVADPSSFNDTTDTLFLNDCTLNLVTGQYEKTLLYNDKLEPTSEFTRGYVYTEYASDSCDPVDKIRTIISDLSTCVAVDLNGDGTTSYLKYGCNKGSIVQYAYKTSDCSGSAVKTTTAAQTCQKSSDSYGAITYVTTECLAQFAAPTPMPSEDYLSTEIQGWVNDVVYDDEACTKPAAFMSSYSVGLCQGDFVDPETGIQIYATTQLTEDAVDKVLLTKYWFTTSDCTGPIFNPSGRQPEVTTITQVNACEKIQYGAYPAMSHRVSFFDGQAGILPPGPFTGGYFYTQYDRDSCRGMDAVAIFAVESDQCFKFYNGTHFRSSIYSCDSTEGTASITNYDSDDCGVSKGDGPASDSTKQFISPCSADDDGSFYSLQCVASFESPTPAPQPDATISTWIQVDHFGTDSKCSEGAVIDSFTISYGLCVPVSTGTGEYQVSVVQGTQDEAVNAGSVQVVTYYYADIDCTEETSNPATETLPFWNCEIDDTGSYALSYMVLGPLAPELPLNTGYTVTTFDSDSCYADRELGYSVVSEGYCISQYDSSTSKYTSFVVKCSSSGAAISTYKNQDCTGTAVKTSDPIVSCVATDESDPLTSYFTVECGSLDSPTLAPTRSAPLEIQGWLSTAYYQNKGCADSDKDEVNSVSFGLCMQTFDAQNQTLIYYVQDLVFDPEDPTKASFPLRVFRNSECSDEITDSGIDLTSLAPPASDLGSCSDDPSGQGSTLTSASLGPPVPATGWTGGFMSATYNEDSCSWGSIVSMEFKPIHQCTPDPAAGTSYQLECTAFGGAVMYTWHDQDCGVSTNSKPLYNNVVPKKDCESNNDGPYQDTPSTFSSISCYPSWEPMPTGPPAPAPSQETVSGHRITLKYRDSSCSASELEESEVWSFGLCQAEFNARIGLLKHKIAFVDRSPNADDAAIITSYYYDDDKCTIYRNEASTQEITDLGSCVSGGDGHFYTDSLEPGPSLPQSPFNGGVAVYEYSKDGCQDDQVTHARYLPVGSCVAQSSAVDQGSYYYYYYYAEKGYASTQAVCTADGGFETHLFDDDACSGEYQTETHAGETCQLVKADKDGQEPDKYRTTTCSGPTEAPTPAPQQVPSSSSSTQILIDFTASQVIDGCPYATFAVAQTKYKSVLVSAIAQSCSTPQWTIPPSFVVELSVAPVAALSPAQAMGEREKESDAASRLLSSTSLKVAYRVSGVLRVDQASSDAVAAALKEAVTNGDFNLHLQEDARAAGASGFLYATSNNITTTSSTPVGSGPSTSSSSSQTVGITPGAAAGVAFAVIIIVLGLGFAYWYFKRRPRSERSSVVFEGKNAMFGNSMFGAGAFDPRRPNDGTGTFGEVHNQNRESYASEDGSFVPSLMGTRTNPLRDQIPRTLPDPAQYSQRRIGKSGPGNSPLHNEL